MKTVIIVSKCSRVIKFNRSENLFHFHFQGVCSGMVLNHVILKGAQEFKIEKGEEYLLYVKISSCLDGVLHGEILKIKTLSDCWDRS